MKNIRIMFLAVFMIIFSSSVAANEEIKEKEIALMKEKFQKIVESKSEEDEQYKNKVFQDALKKIQETGIIKSQYFVYIDRNPQKQLIFICFFNAEKQGIIEIGRDRVSTGKPENGRDYFFTPVGVYKNSVDNFNYRAEGTKNDFGWRGLGKQGSRVWDFGWVETKQLIKGKEFDFCCIRLLMHATDPDYGEVRLGKPDSKGCIRVSAKMNEFLDVFGVLDENYEENKQNIKAVNWLLRKDRVDVKYKGQYLIVGDSGE